MDWDAGYVVSRTLTFQVKPPAKLVASVSKRPHAVELDAIPVLLAFASPATPRAAFAALSQDWELEEDGFEAVVGRMIEWGFLVPAGDDAAHAAGPDLPAIGFSSPRIHLAMLMDPVRVLGYRGAIERHARNKTVVEIGCGSGILSLFAARAGARRVIAIEQTNIAEVAAEMFAANGCSDLIELRVAHSLDVELDEPADLIIHEILGVEPFEENILPVLADARRRLLRPGGRLLPRRLEVCAIGVEVGEPPFESDAERLLSEARELPGLYGLDFEPLRKALERAIRPNLRYSNSGSSRRFERRLLSEECRLLDLDLENDELDLDGWSARLPLRILREGTLGGVVVFFRAHLDEQTQLTNSPFAPATHWGWTVWNLTRRLPVKPGDEALLEIRLESVPGSQRLHVDLA